jgi:hypothetical protein
MSLLVYGIMEKAVTGAQVEPGELEVAAGMAMMERMAQSSGDSGSVQRQEHLANQMDSYSRVVDREEEDHIKVALRTALKVAEAWEKWEAKFRKNLTPQQQMVNLPLAAEAAELIAMLDGPARVVQE